MMIDTDIIPTRWLLPNLWGVISSECRRALRDWVQPRVVSSCPLESRSREKLAGFDGFSPPSEGRWRETVCVFAGSLLIVDQLIHPEGQDPAHQRSTRHVWWTKW